MPKEIKPIQISEAKVKSWRKATLVGGITLACITLVELGLGIWAIVAGEIIAAILCGIAAPLFLWRTLILLHDYRGSAWMKTFWEEK